MPASRQAKVTDENRAESAQLRALWAASSHGMTQAEFGEKFGIGSQAAVGFFLNGRSALSLKAAQGFSKGLKCEIGAFSPRLSLIAGGIAASINPEGEDFVYVRHADVRVSAGHGSVVYEDGHKASLSFRRDYLRKQGVSEKNAVVVDVRGQSMEPMIADGSVLLVSRAHQKVTNGLIYAFRCDGELFVKKLFQQPDGYLAQSENPDKDEYPDMHIHGRDEDGFEMIGRAIWMGKKL